MKKFNDYMDNYLIRKSKYIKEAERTKCPEIRKQFIPIYTINQINELKYLTSDQFICIDPKFEEPILSIKILNIIRGNIIEIASGPTELPNLDCCRPAFFMTGLGICGIGLLGLVVLNIAKK